MSHCVLPSATVHAAWKIQSAPTTDQLRAVDGYSENRILAVGNYGAIIFYNGTEWQNVSGITEKTLYGVWWASKNEAFAVGDKGLILHFNGEAWTVMNSGTTLRLRAIWGASASDVFAVGETGTILHYDGSSWKKMTCPTPLTVQGIWGNSGTDVYAVGGASASDTSIGSFIIHYDGRQWTTQADLITPERFHGVWGEGDTVFAAGEAGAIFFSDTAGTAWSGMNSKTVETFRGLWGLSDTDVYAVGDYGTILQYDGSAWQPMSSGTNLRLFSIWGSSQKSIYAVGDAGLVLHYEDNSTDNNTPACPFKAAVADEDDLRLLRAARDSHTRLSYRQAASTAPVLCSSSRDSPHRAAQSCPPESNSGACSPEPACASGVGRRSLLPDEQQLTTDLVCDGYGINMRPWTRNDLVIYGPPEDPAHIRGMKDGVAALRMIAAERVPLP